MARYYDSYFPRYVPVAERRRRAAKEIASMKKGGRDISPVEITGRRIATTFWGEAWCKNLEAYSDYANRLPRGRSYVRNGSVLDLQIEPGHVRTLVSGTELYTVDIAIKSLGKKKWAEIKGRCAGQIDSLVELLRGSISRSVMEIVTRKGEGLFPSPREVTLDCSCPDWATMCKHVAATLYGVGARLDHRPELLFTLRGVDPIEMVEAAVGQPAGNSKARKGRVLEGAELSSVFGVDIDTDGISPPEATAAATRKTKAAATRKTKAKSTTADEVPGRKRKAATSPTKKSGAAKVGVRKTSGRKRSAKKAPTRRIPVPTSGTRKPKR